MKFKLTKTMMFVGAMLLLSSQTVFTQTADEEAKKLAALAQNPIANAISLPIQYNANFGYGPDDDDMGSLLNIQPVIPVKLNDEWNFIARTIFPITRLPVTNEDDVTGLGDIQFQGYFTPAAPEKLIWGIGPVLTFPTATDDYLGAEKFSIGPGVVLLTSRGPLTFGGLINHQWSVAGEDDRADVSATLINPFVNYNLKGGWYLTSDPNITVNWEADSGNMWTVPVGGGIGRAFKIGKQAVNAKLAYYYNV